MSEKNREIAATILKQLGGNKFIAMTGAKELAFGEGTLSFKIGRNSSKANNIRITLKGDDTYKMEFIQFRKMEFKTIKEHDGIYNDQLQELFTAFTGLYTSL